MAANATVTTSEGLLKDVNADGLDFDKLINTSSVVFDLVDFDKKNRTGKTFRTEVPLTYEGGVTYNGSGGDVVLLEDAVVSIVEDATLSGVEQIVRTRMAYTLASRAAEEGKQAFAGAWGRYLRNLRKSSLKRLELQLERGQMGLAQLSANPTSNILPITDASWAPAIWVGLEGHKLECWSTQAASATQRSGTFTIVSVDKVNKTITVTDDGAAAEGDWLYFKGARTTTGWNEMAGLVKIASNTGILQGIDAATYGIWAGNTIDVGGGLTFGKILEAITEMVDGGLEDGVILGVSPKAYETLNADLAASRDFDGSYSREKLENGTQSIAYFGQNGKITVRSMPYMHRSQAVVFAPELFKRIGSAELGMGIPGGGDSRDVFFHLENYNAMEARTYTDQALFCEAPAQSALLTGITYP